jgi:Sulfatase
MLGIKALKILFTILVISFYSCERSTYEKEYIASNVIVIVIDGARYSETWGDTTFSNIPKMKLISDEGVFYSNFYNNGPTFTLSGHTAITTGIYQEINNIGLEIPEFPSLFQYWNKKYGSVYPISRIITSKDKLSVLSDCTDSSFSGYYRPLFDCGINGMGIGSGYRHDSITLRRTLDVLGEEHPKLILLSFREPDYSAHLENWQAYIDGIRNTDSYVNQVWEFIKRNDYYKGKTAIFVTNDHGRHLDNVLDGFVSHGDTCNGCRHISLLAMGPDFKKGEVIKANRELIDIPATIAEILRFTMPSGKGKIMSELFN